MGNGGLLVILILICIEPSDQVHSSWSNEGREERLTPYARLLINKANRNIKTPATAPIPPPFHMLLALNFQIAANDKVDTNTE